jgi:hypothetical protein
VVSGPAGADPGGVFGRHPADDSRELRVQDTFGNNQFFWVGLEWFEELLHSDTGCGTRWGAN